MFFTRPPWHKLDNNSLSWLVQLRQVFLWGGKHTFNQILMMHLNKKILFLTAFKAGWSEHPVISEACCYNKICGSNFYTHEWSVRKSITITLLARGSYRGMFPDPPQRDREITCRSFAWAQTFLWAQAMGKLEEALSLLGWGRWWLLMGNWEGWVIEMQLGNK